MSEQETRDDAPGSAESGPGADGQGPQAAGPARFGEAVGAGVFAGALGGLVTHYMSGDRLGLPAFVVALLLLGGVKGPAKMAALIVFGIVAAVVVAIFKQ